MSGTQWSLKDSEKYDRLVLEAIEKVICYEKNGKMFLAIIFKDASAIDYFREEMAFVLDDDFKTLSNFADRAYKVRENQLFIPLAENFQPQTITVCPIPAPGCTKYQEKVFRIAGYKLDASIPEPLEQPTAECLKT